MYDIDYIHLASFSRYQDQFNFLKYILFLHCHRSRRAGQYLSIHHKVSAIPMRHLCGIATQSNKSELLHLLTTGFDMMGMSIDASLYPAMKEATCFTKSFGDI
jgi:hypothetical protein